MNQDEQNPIKNPVRSANRIKKNETLVKKLATWIEMNKTLFKNPVHSSSPIQETRRTSIHAKEHWRRTEPTPFRSPHAIPVQESGETNQFDAESQKQESNSIRKVRNQSKARRVGTRCKEDGILTTSRPAAPKKGTRKRDYLATHVEEEIGEKNRRLREEGRPDYGQGFHTSSPRSLPLLVTPSRGFDTGERDETRGATNPQC